ncbi:hypothetical protein [Streptomyces sp. NPDC006997]|uniref:hypothetical protein n=1 Tax=Streptomyces sp. NPDC006997 TaxID=3155356 RepID=UPI0033FAF691
MEREPTRSARRTAWLGGYAAALAALLSAAPATVTVTMATQEPRTVVIESSAPPAPHQGEIRPA